jgi:serine/threonine protein kinase
MNEQKAGADPTGTGSELVRVLDAYLAEMQAGRRPDRARWLAEHAGLGPRLEEALAGLEFIQEASGVHEREGGGTRLGDFRILREVGRGGMGVVYEAEQISLKRRVALKVLRFGAVADEVAMRRFQREAETVGRLHHTNIVPIFAVGAEEGVRYYAMQFIEGRDLSALTREARAAGHRLAAREVAGWALEAAEALAHAHQRGVIHRDIKPSNLILDREGRIWLTDFGLARRADDVTLSLAGALLGTPRYMSPEQASAAERPVDHRTDIYSLGATLYELVTGRPIFEAATPHEVIAQILTAEPRAPRQLAPGLPRDLETIVLTCIAKEPARRYGTAQALADDLRAFLEGRALQARRPRFPERIARWTKRHRRTVTVSAASAAVSTLLLVGGVVGYRQYREATSGRLFLSSSQPNLLAEVLDAEGRALTPLLSLPMPDPMRLAAGSYRVRVSAPGLVSETWSMDVGRGQSLQQTLHLTPRWLWPPQAIQPAGRLEQQVVPLGERSDLLVLTHMAGAGGALWHELRLLDGRTGRLAWDRGLVFDDASVPPDGDRVEWVRFFQLMIAPSFAGSSLADRIRDLDGDGVGDLVFLSRNSPSLLAVSGRTGAVLWWHRARPELPAGSTWTEILPGESLTGFVVGYPAVADLNGDGTADYVVCIRSEGDPHRTASGARVRTEASSWVEAVCGKTGASLWQRPVEGLWRDYVYSSTAVERFDVWCRPAVGRMDGRLVVVLVDGSRLFGWDGATGEAVWAPVALEPGWLRAPDWVDLNGTGANQWLWLRGEERGNEVRVELVALELPGFDMRWRKPVQTLPSHMADRMTRADRVLHMVTDLEGDGGAEIVLVRGEELNRESPTFGIELLDGSTGVTRWRQLLWMPRRFPTSDSQARVLIGPDLDGDGSREIIAAWPGYDEGLGKHVLTVAALSGADGTILWRVTEPGLGGAGSLLFWQPGSDGWPLLVVTPERSGGVDRTLVLATGSGRIEHVLAGVNDVQVADFNGDGLPDLLYTVRSQDGPRRMIVRGTPPEPWRWLGAWRALGDVDADGYTDLVGPTPGGMLARSGRDGRVLWRSEARFNDPESMEHPPEWSADFDGDGSADVLALVEEWRDTGPESRGTYQTFAAFRGKDGRRLWTADGIDPMATRSSRHGAGWSHRYPRWHAQDLDGDGSAELLVGHLTGEGEARLTVLSGSDGRVRWTVPVVHGGFGIDPRSGQVPVADFNGDGVLDVAVLGPGDGTGTGGGCQVDVIDGRNGQRLWTRPFDVASDERNLVWPEAMLGDLDRDGIPEIAVVRHAGFDGDRGYACELVVLDGRSGQVRWTWDWTTSFPDLWPPLFLEALDSNEGWLCLGVQEQGVHQIVVLDAGGGVRTRRTVTLRGNSPRTGASVWRAVQVDGTGRSLLVYEDDDWLNLASGMALEVRWRWRMEAESCRLLDPVRDGGGDAMLMLWAGQDLFGLDAATGKVRWRGWLETEPRWGGSDGDEVSLLQGGGSAWAPRIQLTSRRAGSGSVLRDMWPTTDTGRYR